MMILLAIPLLLMLVTSFSFSQTEPIRQPTQIQALRQQQTITGGFGMTIIDGKPYYLFHLYPEFIFGKVGIGLDLNIRVGEDGKIRSEDFDEVYDYFRIIRYIRYGLKKEPFYARVGSLDYATLGHGFIVYRYRNTASYDLRKIGLELDADFEHLGFEAMYSDFGGAGVFGARGYLRPLKLTDLADVPILGGMETGATFAQDFHRDANRTLTDPGNRLIVAADGGSMSVVGLDIGFPLLSLDILRSTLYTDYAKIVSYGNGLAVGIGVDFIGLGLVTLSGKYERRFMGDQFLPSYFNALYERERFVPLDTVRFTSKAETLRRTAAAEGYYGELAVSVLGTFYLLGGYYSPVGQSNAGVLHLELDTGNALPGIVLLGGYDRKNIGSVFKLDNNSILYGQIGYKPYPFLLVSMLYEWTFTEEKDSAGRVVGYQPQRRVEPRVEFVVTF